MPGITLKNELGTSSIYSKKTLSTAAKKSFSKNWDLYLLITPVVLYFIIFNYIPMYGIQIAFKNYITVKGITGSSWVGLKHFQRFFESYYFWRLMGNTLGISLYQLAAAFPIPILLALMLNEVKNKAIKGTVQMVTYAPHFLSLVVLIGMMASFLSPKNGIVNILLQFLGYGPISFMTEPAWFKSLYVWSGIWQNAGWASIIYIAALAGIDSKMYEAAEIDGASRLKRLIYITVPCILPTAIIILIMDVGRIMNVGFEKVFLMQNALNKEAAEVISTYVYMVGILGGGQQGAGVPQYSFASAVGLFNAVINFTLLVIVNKTSKKLSETSLW